jgi:hypothetical protein
MKKLFTITALLTLLMTASATSQASDTPDACELYGDSAEAAMGYRQAGVPLNRLMSGDELNDIGKDLILLAYKKRIYRTDEYQERVTREFRDAAELECYSNQ